ncbi:MAG: 30S ribosomal protein S9, partial [Chloroflexi bacterium]
MTDRYYYGTGKRKTAIARVRLVPGNGSVVVNGRPLEEHLPLSPLQALVLEPLRVTNRVGEFNVIVKA